MSHGIIITTEYLPNKLNVQADWESRSSRDSSDWKLHRFDFHSIIKYFGYPTVELFASRLCHQLPQYVAWKPDSNSIATNTMQPCWNKVFPYASPPFQSDKLNSEKVRQEKLEQMIIVTPTWQTQPWYSLLLKMSIQCPLLLTPLPDLLLNPQENKHPLIQNRKLMLAA